LGLNGSLPEQYVRWLGPYLHGDLGRTATSSDVGAEVLGGIPESLLVLLGGLGVYAVVGFVWMVVRRGWRGPRVSVWPLVIALPVFWLGLMVAYVFGIHLRLLPTGAVDDANVRAFWSDAWFSQFSTSPTMLTVNLLKHLVLPSATFAMVIFVAARVSRSGGANAGVRTVGAPHQSPWMQSVLDNVRGVDLTVFVSILLAGLVTVEGVFSYSGLGYGLIASLSRADYAESIALLMLNSALLIIAKTVNDWLAVESVAGVAKNAV